MNKKSFFLKHSLSIRTKTMLFFAFLTLFSSLSFAQSTTSNLLLMPSTSRDIAFIFHKITNTTPDYDRGIRNLKSFKESSIPGQAAMLATEKARYSVEFSNLDIKNKPIIARSAVILKPDTQTSSLRVSITKSGNGFVYFPYSWADINYAIIPNQLDRFLNIPLSGQELTLASSKIGGSGNVTMVLEMIPLSADAKAPMNLDNIPQWLLMTKITRVTFYNAYLEEIWSWSDPNYLRPEYSPIKELKK